MTASTKTFVRPASGLVRALSLTDCVIFQIGIAAFFAIAQMVAWVSSAYPGGDGAYAMLLCLVVFIPWMGLVYGLLGAAFPRSGGDYVYVSRILHPILGFVTNWAFTWAGIIVMGTIAGYVILNAVAPTLFIAGVVSGSADLINLGAWVGSAGLLPLGILFLAGLSFTHFLPMTKIRRLHQFYFVLNVIWLVLIIGIFLVYSNADFVRTYNSYFGSTMSYDQVIAFAEKQGWQNMPATWAASLPAMAMAYQVYNGFNFIAYVGGEVKNAEKTIPQSIIISGVAFGLLCALMSFVTTRTVGTAFNNAINWLFWTKGNAVAGFSPFGNAFAALLTGNVLIVALIGFTMVVGGHFLNYSAYTLTLERNVFAWAFDRVVPTRMAYVSPRFHAPIVATLFVLAGCIVFHLASLYTPYFFGYMNAIGMILIAVCITSIAAIVYPYRLRDQFEKAPGFVRAKVGGVPIISLVGLVSAIVSIYLTYYSLFSGKTGPGSPEALALLAGVFVSGAVIHVVSTAYRKRVEGVDMKMAFKEIPPE